MTSPSAATFTSGADKDKVVRLYQDLPEQSPIKEGSNTLGDIMGVDLHMDVELFVVFAAGVGVLLFLVLVFMTYV